MIKSESVFAFSNTGDSAITPEHSVAKPTRRNLMNMMVSAAALTAASTKLSCAEPYVDERSPPSNVAQLWKKRQALVEHGNRLCSDWKSAFGQLPAWAAPGPRLLAHDGTYCDAMVGWPLNLDVSPPDRPGAFECAAFHLERSVKISILQFGPSQSLAKREQMPEPRMRTSMRKLIARLRAKRKEWARFGLDNISEERDAVWKERCDIEDIILESEQVADAKAAGILISLQEGCCQIDTADENATMRMACIALGLLQPQLTRLVAEHAAYFLANRKVALRDMPFALS